MVFSFICGAVVVQYRLFPFEPIRLIVQTLCSEIHTKRSDYFYHKKSFFEQHGNHSYDAVLIGDSLTDDAEWQDLFPSLRLANRGIDGDRTEGVLNRLEGIYSSSASKAFIMIGINDFSSGKNVNEVFNNYKDIVNKLVDRGIEVYIQSTILAGKQRKGLNKNITLLNDRLQKLAQQNESITYIDLNKGLAPNFHLEAKYTRDGVHLNGDGYAIWKELIKPYITNS
jgi:lysophospholipase L1-like esterase